MSNTPNNATQRAVATRVWRGWAVVSAADWNSINDQRQFMSAVLRCTTWGEYRQLAIRDEEIIELVYQSTDVEVGHEPDDETPFHVDLFKYENLDRDQWLMRATTDLLSEVTDEDFPCDGIDMDDMWTSIDEESIDEVISALVSRGIEVTREAD